MLSHSLHLGRNSSKYTQFFTIRHQCSAYSNEYLASKENDKSGIIIESNLQSKSHITHCPTHYLWFSHWGMVCKSWMGYTLKKAISNILFLDLIYSFRRDIKEFIRQE